MAKCRNCKVKTENPIIAGIYKFCAFSCAVSFANAQADKARAKKVTKAKQMATESKKANSKALKEFNRKDLKWQHKQTQPVFNKMRVLEEKQWFADRGLEPTCISCGKPNMDWCAAHFKSRGAQSNLRYDRSNIFLGCNRYCNMALSGNIEGNKTSRGYKKGLIERFGEVEGQRILDYCEENSSPVKWTWEELEKMRKSFNERIRELS